MKVKCTTKQAEQHIDGRNGLGGCEDCGKITRKDCELDADLCPCPQCGSKDGVSSLAMLGLMGLLDITDSMKATEELDK